MAVRVRLLADNAWTERDAVRPRGHHQRNADGDTAHWRHAITEDRISIHVQFAYLIQEIVDFVSIFPGWYPGRAPHIHAIIRDGIGQQSRLITTQSYFYDDDLAEIYALAPYDVRSVNSNSVYNDQFAPDDPVAAARYPPVNGVGSGSPFSPRSLRR